jgi:2'-5' RNA ligase
LRKKIFQAASVLKGRIPAKLVEEENLHLTLLFFKNLSEKEIADLLTAVEEAVKGLGPFALRVVNAEAFPSWRPRGVWLKVVGETEELKGLWLGVIGGLRGFGDLGMRVDERFSPHITLCRFKKGFRLREESKKLIERIGLNDEFKVGAVSVFQSHLSPKGPTYSKIAEIKLR